MFVKNGEVIVRFLATDDGLVTIKTESNGLSFLETLGALTLATNKVIREVEIEAQKSQIVEDKSDELQFNDGMD